MYKDILKETFSKSRLIMILSINMAITLILTVINYDCQVSVKHVFVSNFIFSYSIGLFIYIGINIIENFKTPKLLKVLLILLAISVFGIMGSYVGSYLHKVFFGIDISILNKESLIQFLTLSLIFGISAYFLFVVLIQSNQRKLQLLEEQKLRTDIELKALRARINPHFLFNTLNSVAGLIYLDQKKAESMIVQLSELLRFNLSISENKYVKLEQELKAVEDYLNIEKIRLGDRLNYSIENSIDYLSVPPMSLLTLVENAIKHGISKSIKGGDVCIELYETSEKYYLSVFNTCDSRIQIIDYGYGLTKLSEMLRLSYHENAELAYETKDGGVTAVIRIRR